MDVGISTTVSIHPRPWGTPGKGGGTQGILVESRHGPPWVGNAAHQHLLRWMCGSPPGPEAKVLPSGPLSDSSLPSR